MSTGHQTLTYAICTPQQQHSLYSSQNRREKAQRILEFWFDRLSFAADLWSHSWKWRNTEWTMSACTWAPEEAAAGGRGGEPWRLKGLQQCGRQADSHLAMYTFVVGPWLPHTSVISSNLAHTPRKQEDDRKKGEKVTAFFWNKNFKHCRFNLFSFIKKISLWNLNFLVWIELKKLNDQ